MNPYQHTKDFWFDHFRMAMMDQNEKFAYECYLRWKYWHKRAKLWDYLADLCKQKEFSK